MSAYYLPRLAVLFAGSLCLKLDFGSVFKVFMLLFTMYAAIKLKMNSLYLR